MVDAVSRRATLRYYRNGSFILFFCLAAAPREQYKDEVLA